MASITHQLTDAAYAVGWGAVRRMPESAAYRIFGAIAERVWARRGKQVLQYEANLRRVLPEADDEEIRRTSRAGFHAYMQYWCDTFRMPDWGRDRIITSLGTVGEHNVVQALDRGKGVVIVASHSGNYDHGAAYLAQKYGSMTTVAERLNPESLFDRFVAFREGLGMEVRGTGDAGLMPLLESRVRDNRIVCLIGDRDLSRRGVPVSFFGEAAKMPPGSAALAYRTGAPLHAVAFWTEGRKNFVEVFDEIEFDRSLPEADAVAQATQMVADVLERGIARNPKDWHMLQKLFLADLDPTRAPREV